MRLRISSLWMKTTVSLGLLSGEALGLCVLLLLNGACSPGDKDIGVGGEREPYLAGVHNALSKNADGDVVGEQPDGPKSTKELLKNQNFLDAIYEVKITSLGDKFASQDQTCIGEARVNIAADFGSGTGIPLEIPEGKIHCNVLGKQSEVDIAQLMSLFLQCNSGQGAPLSKSIDVADNVIGLNAHCDKTFEPSRPFLPSVFRASPSELAGLKVRRRIRATDPARGESDTGTLLIETISKGKAFKAPAMKRTFRNTLHWHVESKGFDKLDQLALFLYDDMEMVWNLDPIAIPYIRLRGTLRQMVEALENGPPELKAANPFPNVDEEIDRFVKGNSFFSRIVKKIAKNVTLNSKVEIILNLKSMKNLKGEDGKYPNEIGRAP